MVIIAFHNLTPGDNRWAYTNHNQPSRSYTQWPVTASCQGLQSLLKDIRPFCWYSKI
jgi:hypothetical protein